jgi:hypothetical protein
MGAKKQNQDFTRSYKSQQSALWKATVLFTLVSESLIAADQLSIRCGLEESQRIVDDLLGGLIAGSIFHLYECNRLRRVREQLHVIDLMNHHIRNALQPNMFGPDESGGKAHVKLVEEWVRHIDWALREVLPGKSKEQFVAHDGGFVRIAGSSITSRAPISSKTQLSGPKPTTRQPKPPFTQWVDIWREPK